MGMSDPRKSDPTKDPEFRRVLGNLLKAKPKRHAEMIGRRRRPKKVTSNEPSMQRLPEMEKTIAVVDGLVIVGAYLDRGYVHYKKFRLCDLPNGNYILDSLGRET